MIDLRIACVAIACMLLGGPAAAQLLIAPTTVQFEAGRRSAAIEITNHSDTEVDLQFRAYAWSQADGQEVLAATDALAVSPAITTVAPQAKQVFRVLDIAAAAAPGERTYRLKLNQIPRSVANTIGINLEFSLPVFLTPKDGAPRLRWEPAAAAVRLSNDGDRRMRIAALAIRQPDGTMIDVPRAASAYLLAGASRSFAVPAGAVAAGARLVGSSDAGPIDVALPVLATR